MRPIAMAEALVSITIRDGGVPCAGLAVTSRDGDELARLDADGRCALALAPGVAELVVQRGDEGLRRSILVTDGARAVSIDLAPEGRYQLVGELGRGGMGVVHRAHDTLLGRTVAVKMITDEVRQFPGVVDALLDEARALASLAHPHLVALYDAQHSARATFLVMELVEGTSLAGLLDRRGALPIALACEKAAQVADALAYCHARGVVHRDVKPANVLVGMDGVAKLADFGLARSLAALAMRSTRIRGTPGYMAPEQFVGTQIGAATDVYSLAVTVYELVTNRLPFEEGEVSFHHVHTTPEPPSRWRAEVPPQLDALLLECLAKNPSERPTAAVVAERLRAIAAAGASSGEAQPAARVEGPTTGEALASVGAGRARLRVALLIGAGLALAIAGGVALWRGAARERRPAPGTFGAIDVSASRPAPPISAPVRPAAVAAPAAPAPAAPVAPSPTSAPRSSGLAPTPSAPPRPAVRRPSAPEAKPSTTTLDPQTTPVPSATPPPSPEPAAAAAPTPTTAPAPTTAPTPAVTAPVLAPASGQPARPAPPSTKPAPKPTPSPTTVEDPPVSF